MGHPMHESPFPAAHEDFPRMFFIPIPMAMFGVIVSFMFGATIGAMIGKKCSGGSGEMKWGGHRGGHAHGPGGWGHKMAWKQAMMEHHHHGMGPACRCEERAPGATDESARHDLGGE
jgi:hypothetical protein